MTKVLVVDDHESMRESLERLFNESGDFCVVGGISCADHAVRMCGELSPDIVFMDVCTEGGASGLRATKEVRDAFPDIKVIVMSGGGCFPEPKTIPMPQGEAPLTEREMEILRLMCKHMTNKEIAAELYISEDTVKYHKKNMLAKTGFARSVDLAFYMISNGWINPLY